MIKDFILPDIGEGIVECEVVEWLVQEGETIEEDQPVVELMTDKAVVQIPSMDVGKIVKYHYQKGEIAKVHEPLFAVEVAGDGPKEASVSELEKAPPIEEKPVPTVALPSQSELVVNQKVLATPAVRRLGRELNIDLKTVKGSGKNGRILKEDLTRTREAPAPKPSTLAVPLPDPVLATQMPSGGNVQPLSRIQIAMSKRMTESASEIPHFGYGDEVDLTELMALRQRLKPQLKDSGVNLTMMPFFMKALAMAVQEYPLLNCRYNVDAAEVVYQEQCNIGLAVDTPIGLLVPNVKNVQSLSIFEIAKEMQRVIETARKGRMDQKDMQGGTITISNIGAIGGTFGMPIISKPEVVIVALGKAQTLPRYSDSGELQPRKIMQANWSADHRIIDGATMARFGSLWKQYLEDTAMMLIHLS